MLAITAIRASRNTSGTDDAMSIYSPTSLMVFDPDTLERRTVSDLSNYRGNAVVTEDAIYVAASSGPYNSARLYRVDLETGDLGAPIGSLIAPYSMFLSASGGVLMATGDPSSITFFDIESDEQLGEVDLGITDTRLLEMPFSMPVQMWGANPFVITGLGDVFVIEDATG